MNKHMFLILALLFVLISIPLFGKSYEQFTNLTPGSFPVTVSEPLLFDTYPTKEVMGVSSNTYQMNSKYYPIFGSSFKQKTNNVRFWSTPNNGLCTTADFCGGIYDEKEITDKKTPNPISFSSPTIRVNFFGSHVIKCPETNHDE